MLCQKNINDSACNESNNVSAGSVVTNSNAISFEQHKELLSLREQIA